MATTTIRRMPMRTRRNKKKAILLENVSQKKIRKKQRKSKTTVAPDIPLTAHYHRSWMHASTITAVAHSAKHGYVVTGDAQGVVKFWKRTAVQTTTANATDRRQTASSSSNKAQPQPGCCLEFVKSFTAHADAVLALEMDSSGGDQCVSVVAKKLQFYDVSTFDAVCQISTSKQSKIVVGRRRLVSRGGRLELRGRGGAVWIQNNVGAIYVYSPQQPDRALLTIKLHAAPVTVLKYYAAGKCLVSGDQAGGLEVWNAHGSAGASAAAVGDECG